MADRKTHAIRLTTTDGLSWVLLERIDQWTSTDNGASLDNPTYPKTNWKKTITRLDWGDGATRSVYGPADFATMRTATPDVVAIGPGDINSHVETITVTVANPADPSQTIDLYAVKSMPMTEYGDGTQARIDRFVNDTGSTTRSVSPLRITNDSDPSQYLDVECVDQYRAIENGYGSQSVTVKLDNAYIKANFSAPPGGASPDPIRLDPFQNIINVSWSRTAAALIAGYDDAAAAHNMAWLSVSGTTLTVNKALFRSPREHLASTTTPPEFYNRPVLFGGIGQPLGAPNMMDSRGYAAVESGAQYGRFQFDDYPATFISYYGPGGGSVGSIPSFPEPRGTKIFTDPSDGSSLWARWITNAGDIIKYAADGTTILWNSAGNPDIVNGFSPFYVEVDPSTPHNVKLIAYGNIYELSWTDGSTISTTAIDSANIVNDVDSDGNSYWVFNDPSETTDQILKYDKTGALQWTANVDISTLSFTFEYSGSMNVVAFGGLVIAAVPIGGPWLNLDSSGVESAILTFRKDTGAAVDTISWGPFVNAVPAGDPPDYSTYQIGGFESLARPGNYEA